MCVYINDISIRRWYMCQSSKISFSQAPVSIYLSLQSQNRLSTGARAKLEQVKYTLGSALTPHTSHCRAWTQLFLPSFPDAKSRVLQGESLRSVRSPRKRCGARKKTDSTT